MPGNFRFSPLPGQIRRTLKPVLEPGKTIRNGPSRKVDVIGPLELRKQLFKFDDLFSRLLANDFELLLCAPDALVGLKSFCLGPLKRVERTQALPHAICETRYLFGALAKRTQVRTRSVGQIRV